MVQADKKCQENLLFLHIARAFKLLDIVIEVSRGFDRSNRDHLLS